MTINVAERIDRSPIGRYQIRVVILCALVALLDGLDIQAMGLVTPKLREEWGLPPEAFGPVLSASLAGILVGMLGLGALGDRFGRRSILLLSFVLVGISSIATGWSGGTTELMIFRFLTGIGIGGCLPNATALTAEYVPAKRLAFFVTLMYSAVPLGGVVGGFIGGPLIAAFGWQSVFYLGGVVPLILCVAIYFLLPESVRFLATKAGSDQKIGRILEQIDETYRYKEGDQFQAASGPVRASPAQLFAEGRAWTTILLWLVFFFSLFGMYVLASWLPTVFTQLGWEMSQAIRTVSYFWLGGIFGGLVAGWLIDRFGPYRVLVPGFILAGLLTAAVGLAGGGVEIVFMVVLACGFGVVGAQLAMTALAADLYPTAIRSTGVGWGLGIGRIGAVLSPIIGGYVLTANWSQAEMFGAAAIPVFICAGGTLLMAIAERHRRNRHPGPGSVSAA
jgi:AAHS family 4-hydroxybenzoate transporter-like MFS transporter